MDMKLGEYKDESSSVAAKSSGGDDAAAAGAKKLLTGSYDLLGAGELSPAAGAQDDNAHTEHYFANERRDLNFGDIDPQAFVQRMSAGAKEAQQELHEKFSNVSHDEFADYLLKDQPKAAPVAAAIAPGMAALHHDFMNAERGQMFAGNEKPKPRTDFYAAAAADDDAEVITLDSDSDDMMMAATKAQVLDAFEGVAAAAAATAATLAGEPADHDKSHDFFHDAGNSFKPYEPAPVKQQAEKFISSEDLLGDFAADYVANETITGDMLHQITDLDEDEGSSSSIPPTPLVREPSSASMKTTSETVFNMPKTTTLPQAQTDVAAGKAEKILGAPVVSKRSSSGSDAKDKQMLAVEAFFFKYGFDTWFKPKRLHPVVESLIYWRDIKKSGIVFGAGLITLFAISCCSVISVFAYLSLLALIGTASWRIYKTVMQAVTKSNEGHPFKQYLDLDLTLSQEKVQNIAGVAVAHINGFVAELRRLFLVQDMVDSIKFGIILWVLTYIGAWFNGMTLVILAFVSLFTLPKVYESNKTSIDTYLDIVRSKLTEVTDKIKAAVPLGAKKPIAEETDKDK